MGGGWGEVEIGQQEQSSVNIGVGFLFFRSTSEQLESDCF